MKLFSISLYYKALFAILAILLPVLVTFSFSFNSNKKTVIDHALDDLTIISEAHEGIVYQFMEMSKRRARDFASDGFIRDQLEKIAAGRDADTDALINHLVKNKKSLDKSINAIHIISLDGRVVAATDSGSIGTDLSDETYFLKGREDSVVVETYRGSTKEPALAISSPVRSNATGETAGVITNIILLSELSKVLSGEFSREQGALTSGMGERKTMVTYLVNREGYPLTQMRKTGREGSKLRIGTEPVIACAGSGREMSAFYRNYLGNEVAGASMCFPSMGWTLLVEIDKDEVLYSIENMKDGAVLGASMVAILIGILFVLFNRAVVGPVRRISSAASEVGKGNYDITIPVRSRDELGALSEAFNTMAREIKDSTAALKGSESRLLNSHRIAHMGNWEWSIEKNKLHWYDEVYRIFGLSPERDEASYELFRNAIHPDDVEMVEEKVKEAIEDRKIYSLDHRIILPDGRERVVHENAEVEYDESGKPLRMVGTVQDITERKEAELELKKLSATIEQSTSIVFISDIKGNIEYVNGKFEEVTGYSKEEAVGKNSGILASGETTKNEYKELWNTILSGKSWRGTFRNRKKSGELYWSSSMISPITDEKGKITNFLAIQDDITEQRKAEERLHYMSSYDELTGLLNRARFREEMNELGLLLGSSGQRGAFLLIDIDGIKFINDAHGHNVGDLFIKSAAELIKDRLDHLELGPGADKACIAGRVGVDEFAVFLPYLDDEGGLEIANLIRREVESLRVVDVHAKITVSIGISVCPDHGTAFKELLARADAALIRIRQKSRNDCGVYRPEDLVLEDMQTSLEWKGRIQKALEEERFELWYQPILCLSTGTIKHYEVLVRMRDEDGSMHMPASFISVAEIFGMIGAIDMIVAEKAMKKQSELSREGRFLTFSINLSGKDLGDEKMLAFLHKKIEETGADPNHIVFEITETEAIHDLKTAVRFIADLKAIGCRFSLDDFGVGFTSFIYLKEMLVDYIKIDGSFIKNLHKSKDDQMVVKSIIEVAKGMGVKTVAEFVGHEKALELLKDLGLDYAQGYLIGKPSPKLVE